MFFNDRGVYKRGHYAKIHLPLFLTVLLGFMLAFGGLVGCSRGEAQSESPEGQGTVKIGVLLDFSGERAEESELIYEAALLAADEINAGGGVLADGLMIELVKKDDGGEYMNSVAGYYQLVEEGVCAVVGTNNAQGMKELIKASAGSNVVIMTPSVSEDFVIEETNFSYQSCISDKYMAEAVTYFVKNELESQRLAILYSAQSDRNLDLYEDFASAARGQKLELCYAAELEVYDGESLERAFGNIIKSGADKVFVPAYNDDLDEVLRAAREAGYEGDFLGLTGCQEGLDTTYGYGIYVPCNLAADKESDGLHSLLDKLGEIKSDGVRPAYEAVYYIRDAIEAGYLATPASIALKLPFLEGSTIFGDYAIGAYGNVEKSVDILCVTDAKRSYAGTVFE